MARGGKFMRAFGRVAIPNITAYWLAFQLMCMMLIWIKPEFQQQLIFDSAKVVDGEWWRAITFLFMPATQSPIWALFVMYFYWMMGTALEQEWGTANYNLYLLVGAVMNIAAAFLSMAAGLSGVGTNVFIMESVFLAFAAHYPEYVIRIYFIIPVKVKWLALLTWVLLGFQLLVVGWVGKAMVVASIANFLIFFRKDIVRGAKLARKEAFRTVSKPVPQEALHRCVVCGATEKTSPEKEFRYCSRCGGKCYCLEHLPGHVCR